ncbi:MAG TPA: hypothetical protein VF077_09085 [Nitrospiraceae bacterium]
MTDTVFVDQSTVVFASWLNDVNIATYQAIGTGPGGLAPTSPADVRQNLGLTAPGGAALIGNDPSGGSLGNNVQEALDLKLNTSSFFTDPRHRWNDWDDADTPLNAQQTLEYAITTTQGRDVGGWVAYIHTAPGALSNDNITPLVGHGHHDTTSNKLAGAIWGVVTEAWSNPAGGAVLLGGEVATIQQYPADTTGLVVHSVGFNPVFKNRLDGATHPVAPRVNGTLYNIHSQALFVTSQARPSDPSWSDVGSGWQTVLKVGDVGSGPGLDREGGDQYPGSYTYKAYTTVVDMTDALHDMAGGIPWHTLYRNGSTHWGMRFDGTLTGALDTKNLVVNAGGAGYAAGDVGTINGGSGSGAQYYVVATAGGVMTQLAIHGTNTMGGSGYGPATGLATTAVSGAGAGLTVDLVMATGYFYGANAGAGAVGGGYAVNDLVTMTGGTAGTVLPRFRVTKVTGGGAIDPVYHPVNNPYSGLQLLTNEELVTGNSNSLSYSNGHGFTVGVYPTVTTGAGAGLTIAVTKVFNDLVIGGERWEYWRMLNPSNPTCTGQRQEINDASFPGNDGDLIGAVTTAAANVASFGHVIVSFAGACTLTLPAPANGRVITVKTIQNQAVNSAAANVLPLAGGAAGTAIVPNTAGKWAYLVGDGINWNIQMAN